MFFPYIFGEGGLQVAQSRKLQGYWLHYQYRVPIANNREKNYSTVTAHAAHKKQNVKRNVCSTRKLPGASPTILRYQLLGLLPIVPISVAFTTVPQFKQTRHTVDLSQLKTQHYPGTVPGTSKQEQDSSRQNTKISRNNQHCRNVAHEQN